MSTQSTNRSLIGRIDKKTGKTETFDAQVSAPGTSRWNRLTLEEWSGPAGEIGEGCGVNHLLSVHAGSEMAVELNWPGRRGKVDTVNAGRLNIMPAGVPYSGRWDRDTKSLVVEISPAMLQSISGRRVVELRPAAAISDPLISNLVMALQRDAVAQSPYGSEYGECLAVAFAAQLVRHHCETLKSHNWRTSPKVLSQHELARIVDFVNENLAEKISVSELATLADMGLYQFTRAFKKATGLPPHRFIIERRIELAMLLLRTSDMPVTHVALQTGFATPNHFSHVFRKMIGTSPTRYRESFDRRSW